MIPLPHPPHPSPTARGVATGAGVYRYIYPPKIRLSKLLCPIHTADATKLFCRVAGRRRRQCVHEFATSSRRLPTDSIDNLETDQTDSIAVWRTTWILIDSDNFFNSDDIMTSVFKKLIFIKIDVIRRCKVCLVSFKIVDRIRRQSS